MDSPTLSSFNYDQFRLEQRINALRFSQAMLKFEPRSEPQPLPLPQPHSHSQFQPQPLLRPQPQPQPQLRPKSQRKPKVQPQTQPQSQPICKIEPQPILSPIPMVSPSTTLPTTPSLSPKTSTNELKHTKKSRRRTEERVTKECYRATKNIAKNFGKAITSFAASELALPYLPPILAKEGISHSNFMSFLKSARDLIQGIDSFRSMLLANHDDEPVIKAGKRVFQQIGIIFVKYFSVNWIVHGKCANKIIYLKHRFKILRRLQNPELFTYLQGPKEKKVKKVKIEF